MNSPASVDPASNSLTGTRARPSTVLLEARDLSKTYRHGALQLAILSHVGLQVAEAEILAIVGKSGSGKSTLLRLLGGLDLPDSGRIFWRGARALPNREGEELRLHRLYHVAFVFQDYETSLFDHFDARQNVALAAAKHATYRRSLLLAEDCLDAVDLAHRMRHRPRDLSGGEKQRVAIARALASCAPLVLADEPTGNLDPECAERCMRLFRDLCLSEGRSLLLVTHDLDLASRHADRVAILSESGLAPAPSRPGDAGHPREQGEFA